MLALCGLLQRELGRLGVEGSSPALLRDLAGIGEVDVVYLAREDGGEPVVRTTLTEMTAQQNSLYEQLWLEQYTA